MTTIYEPPQSPGATVKAASSAGPAPVSPHFLRKSHSLYYVGVKVDSKTGATTHAAPYRLGSDIELLGGGVDENGDHYRIAKVYPHGGGRAREIALPRECLGTARGWSILRARGASIHAAPHALVCLADYLQDEGGHQQYHISKQAGWQDRAYVLPGGAIIGSPAKPMFYHGDYHLADVYRPSNGSDALPHGDPTDWREQVASLARGNSRIMLAMGCAFAAPLLHLARMESGGVHLFGSTSDGKTTAALVGASVWGEPNKQKLSWDATPYALSNEAATRNDGLMVLDEVGQAPPGTVAQAAYNLFNGKGRLQGKAEGGNRLTKSWRVMVMSTGEHAVDTFVTDSGARFNGGQEVRLPSVPSDAGRGMGAIECLHRFPSSADFAKGISDAVATHYGSAGRAFLAQVQAIPDMALQARIEAATQTWYADLQQATSQVKRVARRFALIAESLELATEFGLTGWNKGEGTAAVRRCFDEWHHRNGQTKNIEALIIERAEAFFAAHGLHRFHCIRAGGMLDPCHGRDAAGYIRQNGQGGAYLVYPYVFEKEIAKGFDRTKVAQVLAAAGMLKVPEHSERPNKTHRVPSDIDPKETISKRLYEFISVVNPASVVEDTADTPEQPEQPEQAYQYDTEAPTHPQASDREPAASAITPPAAATTTAPRTTPPPGGVNEGASPVTRTTTTPPSPSNGPPVSPSRHVPGQLAPSTPAMPPDKGKATDTGQVEKYDDRSQAPKTPPRGGG